MGVDESEIHLTGAVNEYKEKFGLGDKAKRGWPQTIVFTSKDHISIVISPLSFDCWDISLDPF